MDSIKFEILKSAADSSTPTRSVSYALLVVSAVVAISFWNALSDSWNKSRLLLNSNQLRWYEYMTIDSIPPECIKNADELACFNGAKKAFQLNPCTKEVLQHQLMEMHSSRISNVLSVSIPFFNTKIDINDLTLYAGVSFAMLLAYLRQKLRARKNYLETAKKILFEDAADEIRTREKAIGLAYILMKQDNSFREIQQGTVYGVLSRLVYGLPVGLLAVILYKDFETMDIGNIINQGDTLFVLVLGSVFLLINILLTFDVIRSVLKIDHILKNYNMA